MDHIPQKTGLHYVILLCFIALTPALTMAEEAENYFILRGGIAMPQDDITIEVSGGSGSEVSFDNGYDISVAFGHRYTNWLRGEVELGYMATEAESMKLIKRNTTITDDGKDEHLYGMLNLVADWKNESQFTLFRCRPGNDQRYPGKQICLAQQWYDDNPQQLRYCICIPGNAWCNLESCRQLGVELRGRYFGSNDREHDNHSAGVSPSLDVDGSQLWLVSLGVSYNF